MSSKAKIKEFTVLAILVAVTVVLQTLGAVFPIKVAGISISLVMIPMTVASCFYGIKGGAIIGGAFGLTVLLHSIMGLDVAGATILAINPFFTIIITFVRGLLAGVLTALVAKLMSGVRNSLVKYIVTGIVAPVFNTSIFIICYATLFNDMLIAGADASGFGGDVFGFIIIGVVGINFLFELLTTALLAPPVCKALEKVNN